MTAPAQSTSGRRPVFPRAAGLDVDRPHADLAEPAAHRPGGKLAAVVRLSSQLLKRDRKASNTFAGRVKDGIPDCGGDPHDPDFTDALAPESTCLHVRDPNGNHLDLRHIGIDRDRIVRKICVHDTSVSLVDISFFEQRLSKTHDHAADPLALRQFWIENSSAVECGNHTFDADRAKVLVDANLHELRAPAMCRDTTFQRGFQLSETAVRPIFHLLGGVGGEGIALDFQFVLPNGL